MKNYFNSSERTRHIILLAMQTVAEEFTEIDAITPEERKMLLKIVEWVKKFNTSIFDRFGEPYKKKIVNTMAVNKLGLYSKYGQEKDCISNCASEDVYRLANEYRLFKCMDCERTDHKDCGVYACLVAVDTDGNDKVEGCPYKM